MNRTARKIAILFVSGLFLANTACTTIKPVYNLDENTYASQINVGDRVRLSYLDGRVREINVTEVSETEIKGTIYKNTRLEPKGYAIVADWDDLHVVETVRISAAKTAGAAVGVVVAIPFLALGALFMGAGA